MAYDFVDTTSRNLLNPGESFTSNFQMGMRTAESEKDRAQQKELSMAQMAERKDEFSALQSIREQQLNLDKSRTMATLSAAGTAQQLDQIKLQQQQYALDQMPKMEANNAYFQRLLSSPQAHGIDGAEWVSQKLGEAPHPDILNPTETEGIVSKVRLNNSASSFGIAQQNKMATELQIMTDATQNGISLNDYRIDPQAPPVPGNINAPELAQAVNSRKSQAKLAEKQAMTDIETKSKIDIYGSKEAKLGSMERIDQMAYKGAQTERNTALAAKSRLFPGADSSDYDAAIASAEDVINSINKKYSDKTPTASGTQSQSIPDDPRIKATLDQARQAIQGGKDPEAVKVKLKQAGINPGLL